MINKLPDLIIGDLVINPPIIQGGMGVRVSAASLASAVANEGAMGVIAAPALGEGMKEQNYVTRSRLALAQEISQARKLSSGPLGVNIMCAMTNYDEQVNVCKEYRVDAIISGAGLPLRLPSLAKASKIKLIPVVSSGKAAEVIYRFWTKKYNRIPDALVVEGPLAGGHLGFSFEQLKNSKEFQIGKLVVEVLDVVKIYENSDKIKIPIIAAGGIFDGKDIAQMLRLGAAGVQMATRFVCTYECDAHFKYKEAYLRATKDDIVIIPSPVGMPGRIIKNKFAERILAGEKINFKCNYKCLHTCDPESVTYCIAQSLINAAYKGNLDEGFAMCGANAYRIKKLSALKN